MANEPLTRGLLRHSAAWAPLLAFALSQPGLAQELKVYDGMDYPSLESIHDKNGGAGWDNRWVGVGQNSLISWWPLDGSANDAGPLGANAQFSNGSFSAESPSELIWSNGSMTMGTNPRTLFDLSAYSSTLGTLMRGTLSAWVKPVNTQALLVIFGAADGKGKNLQLFIQQGVLKYEVKGNFAGPSKIEGYTDLMDGLWHHVAVTCDETGFCKIFVDGQMETSGPVGFFGNIGQCNGVWLGRTKTTNFTRFYRGQIDDAAIWGNVLSQTDIQTLASLPPPLVTGPTQANGPLLAANSLASPAAPSAAFNSRGLSSVGNHVGGGISTYRRMSSTRINLGTNQTTYVSCLMTRSAGTTAASEVHFTDVGGPRCRFGWNASQFWQAGVDKTTSGAWVQPDTPYFVVFKIVSKSGTATDQVFLQIYGPSATVPGAEPTTWTITSAPEVHSNNLDTVWLKQYGSGATMGIDELRIGETWDSVTRLGYGAGCLGNVIGKNNRAAIGSTDYEIYLNGAEPSESVFLSLGISRTLWGFTSLPMDLSLLGAPGCYVLASREATIPTAADPGGMAVLGLPIPNVTSIANRTIYAQWASFAPSSPNPFKLAFSDAMEILVQK